MENSKTLSSGLWPEIPKWLALAFLVISFLGFLDATYLTVKYYLGEPVVCSVLEGCEKVTTSDYATVGAIPIALAGSLYYLVIFVLALFYLDTGKRIVFLSAVWLTPGGILVSLWLLYLQLFVILAVCLYCIFSLVTSALLFTLAVIYTAKIPFYKPFLK